MSTESELHLRACADHRCQETSGCYGCGDVVLGCGADESDPHEAGVCPTWDAIRDAYRAGFLACREQAVATIEAKCYAAGKPCCCDLTAEAVAEIAPEGSP